MNTYPVLIRFKQIIALTLILFVVVGNSLCANAVFAAPLRQGGNGLQVSGAKLELSATPGEVYVHNMQIGIDAQSPPVEVQITANGFGEDIDGQFQSLSDQQDSSPYSGRTLITGIDKTGFRLEPGQTMPVAVTITVPNDATTHARYATVFIDSQIAAQGTVPGQKLGIIVPIVITPVDVKKDLVGEITDLTVGAVKMGQPITAAITVKNTGNYHYKVRGSMKLIDTAGQTVATLPIDLTGTSIIPTFSRRLQMSYAALDQPTGLKSGNYILLAEVTREDGSLIGTRQVAFQVEAPLQFCPGIDNSQAFVQQFTDQDLSSINVRVAEFAIALKGSGKATGRIAVCQYTQEPEDGPRFSAEPGEGGTGKLGLKFVMVRMDGITQGTAQISFRYQMNQLGKVDPNSLFIGNRDQTAWRKLDNQTNQTGVELVQGEIPIAALTSNPLLVLGGGLMTQAQLTTPETQAQVTPRKTVTSNKQMNSNLAADQFSSWLPVGLAIFGVMVVIVGSVVLVQMRRRV